MTDGIVRALGGTLRWASPLAVFLVGSAPVARLAAGSAFIGCALFRALDGRVGSGQFG